MRKYTRWIVSKSGKMFWNKTPHPHSLRTQPLYKRVPRTGTSSMQRVAMTTPTYFTDVVEIHDLRKNPPVGPPLSVEVYTLTKEYAARVAAVLHALEEAGMFVRYKGTMFGKEYDRPRRELLVSALGCGPLRYGYSGKWLEAVQAESVDFEIFFKIANALIQPGETEYTGALVNVYSEAGDKVSKHRDQDVRPEEHTGVTCVSSGGKRVMRYHADRNVPGAELYKDCTDITVHGGQVYIMKGQNFQRFMLHECLAPSKKEQFDTRYSVTCRRFSAGGKGVSRKHTSAEKKTADVVDQKADEERKRKRDSAEGETPGKVDKKADEECMLKRATTEATAK